MIDGRPAAGDASERPPTAIRCDCCGREVMAVVRDGKLVITDRRHGHRHTAVLSYQAGCVTGDVPSAP